MISANLQYYEIFHNTKIDCRSPLDMSNAKLFKGNILCATKNDHILNSSTFKPLDSDSIISISDPLDKNTLNSILAPECTLDTDKIRLEYPIRENNYFNEDWTALLSGGQFASNGKCFTGYVTTPDELEHVFDVFKKVTGTAYSTRVPCCTETFDGIAQEKFLNSLSRPRLFWKMHVGEPHIPYDRVPFMTYGQMAEFPCIFGPKTRKYAGDIKRENKLISLPGSIECSSLKRYKVSCQAHITVRRILRFPDHELVEDSFPGVAALRKAKKQALEDLADAICKGTARPEDRYYVSLPTPLAHSNHDIYNNYMNLSCVHPIHETLSEQIIKLLNKGITVIDQIHTKLYEYVEQHLLPNDQIDQTNRSYYPHKNDITKHVYNLYESGKVVDMDVPSRAADLLDKGLISPIPGTPTSLSNISFDKVQDENLKYNIYKIVGPSSVMYETPRAVDDTYTITQAIPKRMDSFSQCSNQDALESPRESDPDPIDVVSYQQELTKSYTVNGQPMDNSSDGLSPQCEQSPMKSPCTQEAYADTTSRLKVTNCINTSLQFQSNELTNINNVQNKLEELREINQECEDVRSILKLLEYQTYLCRDVDSVNSLRRNLTFIATNFCKDMAQFDQSHITANNTQKRPSESNNEPSPKNLKL